MTKLSVLMITKNAEEILDQSLASVKEIADEIIIIDDNSHDKTVTIAKEYQARIFVHHEPDLGKQRAYGLTKTTNDWVLIIDSDEIVTEKLRQEIKILLKNKPKHNGYLIPFQNHFIGKKISHGGEDYKKMILFRKTLGKIDPALVHEKYLLTSGKPGILKGKIYHYSYRNLYKMYVKFTDYAIREARQKSINGEKTNLKKIFLYPVHMFWARFIKDSGYKDGLFRIPLDLGFAYMEFVTYFTMIFMVH